MLRFGVFYGYRLYAISKDQTGNQCLGSEHRGVMPELSISITMTNCILETQAKTKLKGQHFSKSVDKNNCGASGSIGWLSWKIRIERLKFNLNQRR